MVVAVARIELHIPESHSLKAKRQVVRRVLDRTKAKFHASASEVDAQDVWQRAVLGFAVVSGDRTHAQEMIDKITRFVESLQVAPMISCHQEILSIGEMGEDVRWKEYMEGPNGEH